ncbi:MAG TPA: OmpA family protein [Candidatus Kapabacteria bacterium]|nr:OmpA family protein [Candidatus Kapabacteria bacterium]
MIVSKSTLSNIWKIVASFAICSLCGCGIAQEHYDAAIKSRDSLKVVVNDFMIKHTRLTQQNNEKESTLIQTRSDLEKLQGEHAELMNRYQQLSTNSLEDNANLNAQLEEVRKDLMLREKKVKLLEKKIKERDSIMITLRDKIQKALIGLNNNGLEVNIKDGKVYVSLSNKLLFKSGSTDIDKKGQEALLFIAGVLNTQDDITITIEGHTDNQQVRVNQRFSDNWDLSVLRSTEVARFLTTLGGVDSKRIIAAGRSEYFPAITGDNNEARAANRRTEIIITPRLDAIMEAIK